MGGCVSGCLGGWVRGWVDVCVGGRAGGRAIVLRLQTYLTTSHMIQKTSGVTPTDGVQLISYTRGHYSGHSLQDYLRHG